MAKKNTKEEKLNYSAEIRRLRDEGAQPLYLLWGPEDYLREQYIAQLKKQCLPEGEDSFSYKRMNGPELDMHELRMAVDALPFMTERSLVELRGVDINGCKQPDEMLSILKDIPDYCTVAIVLDAQYEPDGRLKLIKGLRQSAVELKFTVQSQGMLIDWMIRRFSAAGKSVELEAAQRLIFISGDLMSSLILEIEKVAAYAKGDRVTLSDVEAVANHIPEAVVFDMTDYIAQRKYNTAMSVLAELMADKNNAPIAITAMVGEQMRRLYAAKLAATQKDGLKTLMDICSIKYEFVAKKLLTAARGFSMAQLVHAVELCAETDYNMKGGSTLEPESLLKELVLRIAAGEEHA